jgi:alkylhydroperoxidase/carboxymuconolactone decarboxylase family protein YurZ
MVWDQQGFLVRIWYEHGDIPETQAVLRGKVEHLDSGVHRYVTNISSILEFIESCSATAIFGLEQQNVQPTEKEPVMAAPRPSNNPDIVRALDYATSRREMEATLLENSPIYTHQVKMMRDVYGKSSNSAGMTQRERILLGIGMAVYAGPESAIEWTVTRAVNHGAGSEAIRDAIDVALLNGGTFATARARFAYNALALRLKHPAKSED